MSTSYHDRLRETTERRRIPTAAVAAIAGVSEQCARAWMHGEYMPGVVPAEALRVALDVEPPTAEERSAVAAVRGLPAGPRGPYAERLTLALRRARMTRQQLASKIGYTRVSVGSWTSGATLPADAGAMAVAGALGVEVPSVEERAAFARERGRR